MSKPNSLPNPDRHPSTSMFFAFVQDTSVVTQMEVRKYTEAGSARVGRMEIHTKINGEMTMMLTDITEFAELA